MALSLITSIPATCYTSQLQKIELASSGTAVEFRIYYQAQIYYSGNGQTLIFNSSYNTRFSCVAIYDIGSLLETFMLERDGLQQFIFEFRAGTDTLSQTYMVIYCKHLPDITADTLANSNYITNYFTRLVYKCSIDRLPYFAGFGSPGSYTVRTITYSVVYRNPDGTLGTYEMISGGRAGYGISEVDASYDVIRSMFAFAMPEQAELLSYTLKQGSRIARFFVAEQTIVRQFAFRNAYGCKEYIAVPTARKEKVETKSSTALCSDELTQYDITHTRSFEEQTPVLQRAEARRFEEFLTSHYTAVLIGSREHPIIIKDYDLKISDNPGEGNTIKFEWQFASLRTPLISEDYTRIFSPEHTEQFT
ncbi:MAG: hypothetical protein IJ204_09165 [Paludibacteraceae bacterium]|nr:hypothetical protein [Paludibacteraceae bacterium]